ncbi:hypothetical protein DF185_11245 [Marinifilum breve]|uniref:Uncharacterized protein n=1 Tax=Marinifilum breve TaxID=2184082 RepID=A0A2V3ZY90_9BACT|nr:hypothetical protein [Marinifilum breve]PXY01213.1 hypothetical protein DF185_11245 [Marinifilum breve]
MNNYYDIKEWTNKPLKFYEFYIDKNKSKKTTTRISPITINAVKIYSLLKQMVSKHPNGLYTQLQQGQPLDNMIWWDFVLESELGFIHIWRTSSIVEAMHSVTIPEFDLNKFLQINIAKYAKEIEEAKSSFDKHTVYINHYRSYKECVNYLWSEIEKLNLEIPKCPRIHVMNQSEIEAYTDNAQRFIGQSVKFHTLGKSMLLNAAFQIESFLNLIIRIGVTEDLKKYPDVLNKHLKSSFSDKLKNLKFYSVLFSQDINLESKEIKDSQELMTIRNKYVHFDESSRHNKIGEVFYDDDFPLMEVTKFTPAIESALQTYYNPSIEVVEKSYKTAQYFSLYVLRLVKEEYRESIENLMSKNPISYNENRKVYSSIYNERAVDFYLSIKEENKKST